MGKLQYENDTYIKWLEILAPKTKIDITAWLLLYAKYGYDIFYIIFLMAGQNIKMPSYQTIMNAYKTAKKDTKVEILEKEI